MQTHAALSTADCEAVRRARFSVPFVDGGIYLFVVKRNFWRLIFTLFLAADIAAGVVLWRSPDPRYRAREWLAMGRYHEHDALIAEVAGKAEVDALLVKAVVWRESGFLKTKAGSAGERGLMQVGESAARDWAASQRIETFMFTDLFDARTNVQVGTWYLDRALEHWKDRDDPLPFALAEYNAGRSRVQQWAGDSATAAEMLRACDIPSTRRYVNDIIRRYHFYREHGW